MTDKPPQRRPFHETVVEAIERASRCNEQQLLGWLIMQTNIPKGHDEIIAAWKEKRMGLGLSPGFDFAVVDDLLDQKKEAEEEAAKKLEAKKLAMVASLN